ncbi:nuclear pore complex protein NUP155 isoform X2 [Phalaenopsis equestris]|nr:nuclear pore complex protein NUP155 isoform X2 [Phalaenopsis equestris]
MVIDNERHVIYARTEAMKLQVFDLGVGGSGPLKRVAEERNLIDPRDSQHRGRRPGSISISQAAKPSIVSIAPLSTVESKWLHMVAVLSDGRRLYISTSPSSVSNASASLTSLGNAVQRPSCLKVLATRPSPPLGVGGGLTFGAISAANRTQTEDMALKVETAFYSAGMLVFSDSSTPAVSSLLIVNRDPTTHLSHPSNFGISSRSPRALRELVSSFPVEGRMLCVADVLPLPDTAATVHSLYSDLDEFGGLMESREKASARLWARGDLPTQHILPRRKIIVFSTMGLMEIVFNRPVDILRLLFESNAPRLQIEEFFNRFGAGEAAAMCLMLAAKLISDEETIISNSVAERAAETFEDPAIVGMPQLESIAAMSSVRAPTGGFSMGQVVPEAEPLFSGAHEGLCLCASRLLFPVWELPVLIVQRENGSDRLFEDGAICCRLPSSAMQVLESKIRSLEQFIRSRRNKRRGLYGSVAGRGDFSGSILYSTSQNEGRNLFGLSSVGTGSGDAASNKRQRLLYTSAELAAMEVRAMECLRRLLRRSSEALFLLQIIHQHHVARLVHAFDSNVRKKLVHLTFNQLVCSEDGDQLAMQLISGLMEYYTGNDYSGTVDEISAKLRDGCPSYFNESDYKYFLAVECLERAAMTLKADERENLARAAFNHLTKVPESVDLRAVCKRFEDLRFYEAVVRLPLQKAQALDPQGDAFNVKIDPNRRDNSLAQRRQCYEIVMNSLRSLKGDVGKVSGSGTILDQASRDKFIQQIIQLSVQWPDTAFHEYLYRTLIELGLENELLEYGGSDLVSFLQSAGRKPLQEVQTAAALTPISATKDTEMLIPSSQTKYLDLLARYYVMKRQHLLAAHVLYRLAERQCNDAAEAPTLDQRRQYLSNAVLQAKSATSINGLSSSTMNSMDNGLLDLLEAKLAVLRFQLRVKEELESVAFKLEGHQVTDESHPNDPFPGRNLVYDANTAKNARDKAKELELNVKSITQLYNDYAVPFQLWELCLEMLNFANYSGDADSKIVRETWARLIDQALSTGGIAEACNVLKRVGSNLYSVDGSFIPLDTLCLHLEKAALERLSSGIEVVGDEEIARSLLAACRGRPELVLSVYDQLLSNGAIVPLQALRLRLLKSVLVVLREWVMLVLADKLGTTTTGASFMFGRTSALEQTAVMQRGIRDKIASATNRYMTEVRRLALPQSQIEPIYQGFKDLEEKLLSPSSFQQY